MDIGNGEWKSTSIALDTGCGAMFLIVVYNLEGTEIIGCQIAGGKAGGCVPTHLHALSEHLTAIMKLLRPRQRLETYTALMGNECSRKPNCLDVITRCLMDKEIELMEKEDNENAEEH